MTKAEIEKKIAEVKAQGDALQKHNAQLIQEIEVNKVELAKVCGKIFVDTSGIYAQFGSYKPQLIAGKVV